MTSSFTTKYKVIQKIGEGSFSEVLKCEDKLTSMLYAAKRLKKTFKSATDVMTCAEIIAMHKLSRHPNVLYMIEYFYDPALGKLTYVFELMDMSMYEYMKSKKRPMSEVKVRNYLYQMLKGLEHLHKNGLFHRDIKPENILVKLPPHNPVNLPYVQAEIVKLADLGSIRGIYSRPPYTEYISTRWYRSPECLLTVGYYGPKMDVWAAGCVFYEMLTLKPLFPGTNEIDQLSKIHSVLGTPSSRLLNKLKKKSHNCQNFPRQIGSGLSSLIHQFSDEGQCVLKLMIQYDPECRINVRRLVEHRYFAPLRDQYLINQLKFAALQQNFAEPNMDTLAKCTGDHVIGYLSLADNLKQAKISKAVSPKVYNLHKATRKLSPLQTSKTTAELTLHPEEVANKTYITRKMMKKSSPIQNSKTSSDLYQLKHNNQYQHVPSKVYNIFKTKNASTIQNSKTASDLNQTNHAKCRISPKYHSLKKPKKSSPIANSKTTSELNADTSKLSGKQHSVHKTTKASASQNSKTTSELSPPKQIVSPKIAPKPKKTTIPSSKTFADINSFGNNKKTHLVRENGGPLVSLKQFRIWGVNPGILKSKEEPSHSLQLKSISKDEHSLDKTGQKHKSNHRRRNNSNYKNRNEDSCFRKTTGNLPKLMFEKTEGLGDDDEENPTIFFQSKSFVLPRKVTARTKLDPIKESWSRKSKDK
ncbi:Protein kinase domain [Popillia japonica]|uniref:Protein kinase domain n=1 Tax=Popillia japonica TaxID=7064 RepID=A0AAW1NL17_POPJA